MARIPVNVNNVIGRHKEPFLKSGLRFPKTQEIQQVVADVSSNWNKDNPLVDRFFPDSSTFASELEMYMLRNANGDDRGMTLVHQIGANVLPADTRVQRIDLARASWSPLAFKESRTWDEKEMLMLGRLTEEVQMSVINEQISDYIAYLMKRMANRRTDLCWQILTTGQIEIGENSAYNPSGLTYTVDYGFTDMEIVLADKFDDKASDVSLVDPIEFFNQLKKAATYKPEIMPVEIIVNSQFLDVLAENTHIQYIIDWENGWTAINLRPPRAVYANAALDVFKRYTGITVTFDDTTYEDEAGNVHYYIPNGRMILINQTTGPVGNFVYTAHIAGTSNGRVLLGTGPYMNIIDETKGDPPFYKIIGGFHGLPQVKGYSPRDFSLHRIKWIDYADTSLSYSQVEAPSLAYRHPVRTSVVTP